MRRRSEVASVTVTSWSGEGKRRHPRSFFSTKSSLSAPSRWMRVFALPGGPRAACAKNVRRAGWWCGALLVYRGCEEPLRGNLEVSAREGRELFRLRRNTAPMGDVRCWGVHIRDDRGRAVDVFFELQGLARTSVSVSQSDQLSCATVHSPHEQLSAAETGDANTAASRGPRTRMGNRCRVIAAEFVPADPTVFPRLFRRGKDGALPPVNPYSL